MEFLGIVDDSIYHDINEAEYTVIPKPLIDKEFGIKEIGQAEWDNDYLYLVCPKWDSNISGCCVLISAGDHEVDIGENKIDISVEVFKQIYEKYLE